MIDSKQLGYIMNEAARQVMVDENGLIGYCRLLAVVVSELTLEPMNWLPDWSLNVVPLASTAVSWDWAQMVVCWMGGNGPGTSG